MLRISSDKSKNPRPVDAISEGIASMLPHSSSSDDDNDDDHGPKPSELYIEYIWKISKFSEISKREVRSDTFEVGGYKWHILIFPQGCDVNNFLSVYLCVADHDKLHPGWTHIAQFTLCLVNKDPKESMYKDTLHRFREEEHDWGWKTLMALPQVLSNGFVVDDTLTVKVQVQVISVRSRLFRCLDSNYRRELVRVYFPNVAEGCYQIVKKAKEKLEKLIEDKVRWSSFSSFWLGLDQKSRRRLSTVESDCFLKAVVKHFFLEDKVASTLVMDSFYNGLNSLKNQTKSNKLKGKCDAEELPFVQMESDTFTLVDDVLSLLQRAVMEPLPPVYKRGPQNRIQDGDSWKDSSENDDRLLTELGRRYIELTVLAYISCKIEETLSLKLQEELIREEEKEKANAKPKAKPKRASGKGSRVLKR